jgi:plastocyanin
VAGLRRWARRGAAAAVVAAWLVAGVATPSLGPGLAAGAGEPGAAAATVRVGNNFFSPTFTSIRRGRVVVWVWAGGRRHNVTGMTRTGRVVFRSRTTSRAGFRYSHRFRRRASFRVICTVHPRAMRMTVRVR